MSGIKIDLKALKTKHGKIKEELLKDNDNKENKANQENNSNNNSKNSLKINLEGIKKNTKNENISKKPIENNKTEKTEFFKGYESDFKKESQIIVKKIKKLKRFKKNKFIYLIFLIFFIIIGAIFIYKNNLLKPYFYKFNKQKQVEIIKDKKQKTIKKDAEKPIENSSQEAKKVDKKQVKEIEYKKKIKKKLSDFLKNNQNK